MVCELSDLPQIDLIRTFNRLNNLSNLDPDLNLPTQSSFKYYTPDDFCADNLIANCTSGKHFSVLHSNVRSLQANFDKLTHMLSELKHSFSLIGLTKTRVKASQESFSNTSLSG